MPYLLSIILLNKEGEKYKQIIISQYHFCNKQIQEKIKLEYRVKLADQFLDYFEEICDYISNKLKNIDTTNRLREKVIYNILLLENSSKICTEIEDGGLL